MLNTFQSYIEAGDWLLKNNLSKASNGEQAGFYLFTKLKLEEHEFKGYIWKFEEDFSEEYKKEFKEKFKKLKSIDYNKKDKCPICGKLKDIKAIKCSICFNKEAHNKFEEERELKYSINRNILKNL